MKPNAFRVVAALLLLVTVGVFARVSTTQAGAPVAHKSSTYSIVPGSGQQAAYRGVLPVARFDVSPPLHSMKAVTGPGAIKENEDLVRYPDLPEELPGPREQDTVVQKVLGPLVIPTPIISFDGPSNISGVAPPDPNGEVGPNHVVVMDNLQFQIFNKTGTSLLGPSNNNTLWAGFGGPCQTENAGDPVVIYDQLADRWLLTQFTSAGPTYFNCVALSTTSDPTGAYFRWAFSTGANFPDYPKYGMMPVPNAY